MGDPDAGNIDLASMTDYDEHGVDLTLIRAMLDLTPAERLQLVQDFANQVEMIRKLNDRT